MSRSSLFTYLSSKVKFGDSSLVHDEEQIIRKERSIHHPQADRRLTTSYAKPSQESSVASGHNEANFERRIAPIETRAISYEPTAYPENEVEPSPLKGVYSQLIFPFN